MSTTQIHPARVQPLNDHSARDGDYILYWMQQSQRAAFNHALEFAVQRANELARPLLVVFGLMDDYPEANQRHYAFMLEGLQETQQSLQQRGIRMIVRKGNPADVAIAAARDAALVVCDRGYLRHQKQWRKRVAEDARCRVIQVESDVVVPVNEASNKAEYAARTLRPKVRRLWNSFLEDFRTTAVKRDSLKIRDDGLDLTDPEQTLRSLTLDDSVPPVTHFFRGGTSQARTLLRNFRAQHLTNYDENRNQPQTDDVSHMSKYLHFGQISPVAVALAITESRAHPQDDRDSFLEELLVRRELAQNFVEFTTNYDTYDCLPEWARRTLAKHACDRREPRYTPAELDAAGTHDAYWNAAMREMKHTGYMHNYMRMYWGKKILEWTASPEEAYRTALALNNRYFLDGRDANSYANIGWIFGLHDRPWQERPIFGTVRYMAASGLERKCDIAAYVEKVDRLVEQSAEF